VIGSLVLVLCGAAALGVAMADRVGLLLACWAAGAALHAGLAATGRGPRLGLAARRALLADALGVWALVLASLLLVTAAGTDRLAGLVGEAELRGTADQVLPWTGTAVLVAVSARLGLPPLPVWPLATAGAPPLVRVFLHAGVQPLSALLLWQRLTPWLLGWHEQVALWFGAAAAAVLALAAVAEHASARRAALVGTSRWAAVWSLAAGGASGAADWLPWAFAGALVTLQLAVVSVRWPVRLRQAVVLGALLAAIGLGLAPLADLAGGTLPGPAAFLQAVALLALPAAARRWWRDLGRKLAAAPASGPAESSRAEVPAGGRRRGAGWLPRSLGGRGPVFAAAEWSSGRLSSAVASADRVVLVGIVEGLGWLALALGWLLAWLDRRGLDVLGRGLEELAAAGGRLGATLAGGHPGRVLAWSLGVILIVAVLGRTLM